MNAHKTLTNNELLSYQTNYAVGKLLTSSHQNTLPKLHLKYTGIKAVG